MKILFVVPRFHTNQYYWAKTLIDHNCEVTYAVFYGVPLERHGVIRPYMVRQSWLYSVIKLASKILPLQPQWAPSFSSMIATMKETTPDVVIVRGIKLYTLVVLIIARLCSVPAIIYDQSPKYQHHQHRGRIRLFLIATGFVTPVRITPVLGDGPYNDSWAHYLPFVSNVDFSLINKTYFQSNHAHIIAVSKFAQARKNLPMFVDAIKLLRKKGYAVTAEVAGATKTMQELEYLREKVVRDELEHVVTLSPNLSSVEMADLYKRADLFVLPSSNEPAAYSIFEAMNFALPVICSDTNGTQYVVEEGDNGYRFKSGDTEDLVRQMEKIVQNKDTVVAMGGKSFAFIREKYSPEVFYARFTKALAAAGVR